MYYKQMFFVKRGKTLGHCFDSGQRRPKRKSLTEAFFFLFAGK